MDDVELLHLDGAGTLARFEEIQRVYAVAFPGHDLDDHRWRTTRQAAAPGFGCVVARLSRGLAGFVYGLPLRQNTTWWDGLRPAREDGFTTETGTRTCAVIDLAVLPEHRGQGLARRLMSEFLGSRTEERATLATDPRDQRVQAMYERWGWRKAGTTPGGARETLPEFDLYTISLRGDDPISSR